jgi:hypothetical protein
MNPNVLVYACIPVFLVYFYFFSRTMRLLDESERTRFVAEAGQPRWRIGLTAAFVLLLIFVADPVWRALVGSAWIADTAWASFRHHRRLRTMGFDPVFRRTLARVSYLSGAAMLVFVTGMVLKAR